MLLIITNIFEVLQYAGRTQSLYLSKEYILNIQWPGPMLSLPMLYPALCHDGYSRNQHPCRIAFISTSILSVKLQRINAVWYDVNPQLTVSEASMRNFPGEHYAHPEILINQNRTFCGNVTDLTNLVRKYRHISKVACQTGFS